MAQQTAYSDDEDSQDEGSEPDEDSKHFSSEKDEDDDQDVDQEDTIAHFFNAEEYQQLLTKCLSALDLKDKPSEEGKSNANTQTAKRSYMHPNNTL